jgi:hypothetical protein
MQRPLVLTVLFLAGCTYNPLESASPRRLPASVDVDKRLHLSPEDSAQIYRLVVRETNQQVDSMYPGTKKGTVEVICGYREELSSGSRVTGDEFTVEKTGTEWKIVDKGSWIR